MKGIRLHININARAFARESGSVETAAAASIDRVMRRYPERLRPLSIELPPDGSGFSGAIIRRVEAADGMFCLRGWPQATNLDRVRGLHRFLGHLQAHGIDYVAVPLAAADGSTLVSEQGRAWQLEPWLPGRADFARSPSEARLAAATVALARLHCAAATFQPDVREARWFFVRAGSAPALSERLSRLTRWRGDALQQLRADLDRNRAADPRFAGLAENVLGAYQRLAPSIGHELGAATELRVPVQPCLRDVWHDHVLFEGEVVSGIIDASAARSESVASDLSRLLGSLAGDDRGAWERALVAYQAVRPLSPEERVLVPVLDRSGLLLSGMTWLGRRFDPKAMFATPERVAERLQKIVERLEVMTTAR